MGLVEVQPDPKANPVVLYCTAVPLLARMLSEPLATYPTTPFPVLARMIVPRATVCELEALGSVKIAFSVTEVVPMQEVPAVVKLIVQLNW